MKTPCTKYPVSYWQDISENYYEWYFAIFYFTTAWGTGNGPSDPLNFTAPNVPCLIRRFQKDCLSNNKYHKMSKMVGDLIFKFSVGTLLLPCVNSEPTTTVWLLQQYYQQWMHSYELSISDHLGDDFHYMLKCVVVCCICSNIKEGAIEPAKCTVNVQFFKLGYLY